MTTPDAGEVSSFTILTGPAEDMLLDYHTRAPVILERDDWPVWLDPSNDPSEVMAAVRAHRFERARLMKETPSVEGLEAFCEQLQGPMGDLLRGAGVIMAKRMERRGVTWADLSDQTVMDLFHAAFLEAVPSAYPERDRAEVEDAMEAMFADIRLQLAANAEGSDARD